jgi:uncharacterized OsmC-like protein
MNEKLFPILADRFADSWCNQENNKRSLHCTAKLAARGEYTMNAEELRNAQAPLKDRYRAEPASAMQTLKVQGELHQGNITCVVQSVRGTIEAGLHPAAGGSGAFACSGDMLLEALVGCAGVTLTAVATAMNIPIRGGTIRAEGDLDFRGTLGVTKDVDIGFKEIRLFIDVDTDASAEQIETLVKLTKRYCVIFQTLQKAPAMTTTVNRVGGLG